jgi:hypothetical protein
MAEIHCDAAELRQLVKAVVAETIAELSSKLADDGRLAYSEAEAADQLGIKSHVLRDERLRGRVGHTRIAGGRVRYTRQDLLDYLGRNRE